MDEDIKTGEKDSKGDSSPEKTEKKKTDGVYKLFKRESHKDNRCLLEGINVVQLAEFNNGKVITVSNEQIKIIGCKVDDEGNIISIPYRWLGVEK